MRKIKLGGAVFFLLGLVNICHALERDSSIYSLIENLESNDSVSFYQIVDTLSYFAGRDTETALHLAPILANKVDQLDNADFQLKTYLQISQLYLLQSKTDSTQLFLDRCFHVAKEVKDSTSLYSCLYLQGWLYSNMNQIEKARKNYYDALSLAKELNNDCMVVSILSILALSFTDDIFKQIEYLREAVEIGKESENCKDGSYQATLYNLASAYQVAGRKDSAIIIYKKLREIYTAKNYISGIAGIANNEAHLFLEDNDFGNALERAFEAYRYDSITGSVIYLISDLLTIGKVYRGMLDYGKSNIYLKKADSLSMANNTFNKRVEITDLIADNYASVSDYKGAYWSLKEHIIARDSLESLEMNKKVKELEDTYQLKEKEIENENLKTANDKDQKIILQQRIIIFLLFVFLLVFVVLFLSFVFSQRKIKNLVSQIKERNNELKESNETKEMMLSIVSHDLRSPVGNLHQLLRYVIEEDDLTQDQALAYLYTTERHLGTINDLLNNLLYWANQQVNQVEVNIEPVEICTFIEDATKQFAFIAESKNIEIEAELEDCDVLKTDVAILAFIIRNILSNAIKFTPKNGFIRVKGYKALSVYQIDITDSGVGMEEEQIDLLFKASYNKSRKGTNNEPGTGIGMLMVKEFADKCSIDIHVESEIGKGTTFKLKIPLE